MSFDPDFQQTADAWLDDGKEAGQGRILLDILRDSKTATREFAALARTHAALEIASLPQEERLLRAAQLLRVPLRRKLRSMVMKPATQWGAAAVFMLGAAAWWLAGMSGQTKPAQARPSLPPQKTDGRRAGPAIVRTPDAFAPADLAYGKLMDSLLIPDFESVDLPLAEAIAILTEKTSSLGSSPLEVTLPEPEEGLPSKRVHLKLKYQPVSVLLKLIALQSGMKIQATGRSYHLIPDQNPDPADVDYRLVKIDRWESFLESQGLMPAPSILPTPSAGQSSVAAAAPVKTPPDLENFRAILLGTLHEAPKTVEVWTGQGSSKFSPTLNVGSGQKLDAMLELILAGPDAPGTLTYDLRWVSFRTREAVERLFENSRSSQEPAGNGSPAMWSDANLPRLLKALLEDQEVKMEAASPLRVAPGAEGVTVLQSPAQALPEEDENWTGQVCTIVNTPAGSQTTINLHLKSQLPAANGGIVTSELSNTTTLSVGSTFTIGGLINAEGEHMLLVTARLPSAVPYGIAVPDKPGFVRSPYALDKGMVDVGGIPPGVKVKCPFSGQAFRVPE